MTIKNYILLLLSCLLIATSYSQSYEAVQFIENKGQWDPKIKFMGQVPAGALYINNKGFTVVQHNAQDWQKLQDVKHGHGSASRDEKLTMRSHAYNVEFINASPKARIVADKPIETYNNYFIGNDPSKWATNCRIYTGITFQELYPGIDARYYSENGNIKYDLIVKPGADPSKITLKYDGADKLEVKNKELIIKTSVGELKELYPYSYQYEKSSKKEIAAKYIVKDNTVTFEVKNYDPNTTLVIDPTLIFSSFSGSTADNWGFTATYGPDGSMYGGGIVEGQGFPVSSGAYQTTFGGDPWDMGIIKLSPDGTKRIYATYIGGGGWDQPHSLVVDSDGSLVIAGRTNSGTSYPTKGGTGLIGLGGGYDIVVTKLNAAGNDIVGSQRIGGTGDDGVNISTTRAPNSLQQNYGDDGRSEVILDGSGNIYVASTTRSGDFNIVGGFQSTIGGNQDGVLLKLPPDASGLLFSSFLGGSANDAAYVLSLSPLTGDIYIAGGTASNNFPGIASGTISSSYNGGTADGYVSIVSNDGSTLRRSTYLGTGGTDQVFGIQFDNFGFPYVMGQTTGSWKIFNAQWNQSNGRQFIAKLRPDLSDYVYSTAFGTGSAAPNISPVAFLVDRCENVYVSGWGGQLESYNFPNAGVSGLPTTPDAIKPVADVNPNGIGQDFYFFVLKKNATAQLYGSFFGQNGGFADHVDGGTSRFDRNGVIYQAMCANCGGGSFPTTGGAWATVKPGGANCNLAMVKISFDFSGVRSGVQSSINGVARDTAGCVPLTVNFRDTVKNAVSYEWNFGDGSPQVTTSRPDTSHTYTQVGIYRVMLVAIDSTTCNIRDTSYMNIRVGDLQAQVSLNAVKLNPCDAFQYRFDNTSIAPPSVPFTNNSFVWDFGDGSPRVTGGLNSVTHQYAAPGTYRVRLYLNDENYCNAPDSAVLILRVSALVEADFITPPTGCAPYSAFFENTSKGGQQFTWDFGDGGTSNAINPTHIYTTPGTYTVTLTAVDSATCNIIDTQTFTITVSSLPTANYTVSPQPPVENTPIVFTNLSSPDAVKFKWLFGDGDSLITTSRDPVSHEYNATKTYNSCLIAYNASGCADTLCIDVQTLINPALDVPNAFTPLSGDVNSVVYARGFGIAKLKFIIYNRWGQKVFETENNKVGWNGKYKGVLQPMDVYAYTLDVEFSDGTKATKKGDITLIR